MREKIRAGWAWVRERWLWLASCGFVVVVVVLSRLAYLNPTAHLSQFSGLPARPIIPDIQPAKTLWDWAGLLIVPLVLAGAGLWYSRSERQAEQDIAKQRAMDDALKSYLDAMGGLLTDKGLSDPAPPEHVRNLARAYTLTMLNRVGDKHRGAVVRFVYEAGLISSDNEGRPVVLSLKGANLQEAELQGAYLNGASLRETHMEGAYLNGVFLQSADLEEAHMTGAHMSGAYLDSAGLQGAYLQRANLRDASLVFADLSGAELQGAILSGANLMLVDGLEQLQLDSTRTYRGAKNLPAGLTPDPRPWPRPTYDQ